MHNHTPKEPIPPNSNRERPLQKSMFLPEHYPPAPPPVSQPPNESSFNHLKRSLIETPSQPGGQQGHYQFRTAQNNSSSNNNLSLHQFQPQKATHAPFNLIDSRSGSSHELLHHSNSSSNLKHHQSNLQNSFQFEPKHYGKMEKDKKAYIDLGDHGQNSQSSIINQVVSQIREQHLPALLSVVKKELAEEVKAIRQELMVFKEEVKGNRAKQEQVNSQLRVRGNQVASHGRKSVDNTELSELQKDFFLLQGKIKQIQSNLNDRFSKFSQEFQRLSLKTGKDHSDQHQKGLSVSSIRSHLTPIMLEYKQIFTMKTGGDKKPMHEQITISQCNYYIDKNGYLLDHQNRYLVDKRGIQVRLDEKHMKLLQRHKILHK